MCVCVSERNTRREAEGGSEFLRDYHTNAALSFAQKAECGPAVRPGEKPKKRGNKALSAGSVTFSLLSGQRVVPRIPLFLFRHTVHARRPRPYLPVARIGLAGAGFIARGAVDVIICRAGSGRPADQLTQRNRFLVGDALAQRYFDTVVRRVLENTLCPADNAMHLRARKHKIGNVDISGMRAARGCRVGVFAKSNNACRRFVGVSSEVCTNMTRDAPPPPRLLCSPARPACIHVSSGPHPKNSHICYPRHVGGHQKG